MLFWLNAIAATLVAMYTRQNGTGMSLTTPMQESELLHGAILDPNATTSGFPVAAGAELIAWVV